MRELFQKGYNRREVCRELGIHHSTLYRWMDTIWLFREGVEMNEERGKDRRRYRRWKNHPFRDKRPPRSYPGRRGGPYPTPFGAGKSMPGKSLPKGARRDG